MVADGRACTPNPHGARAWPDRYLKRDRAGGEVKRAGDTVAVVPRQTSRRRLTRGVARSESGRLPFLVEPARDRVPAVKKPPRSETPREGSETGRAGGPRQTACSGVDATTRAARVGLKLADHIIAGRSNIR